MLVDEMITVNVVTLSLILCCLIAIVDCVRNKSWIGLAGWIIALVVSVSTITITKG